MVSRLPLPGGERGFVLALGFLLFALPGYAASPRLDHIRATGIVHCGAEARPGLADADDGGRISGVAVDLCRAVAIAVLGPTGQIDFTLRDAAVEFDPVRAGADDVVFLGGGTITDHSLAGVIVPGPTVFIDMLAVLVPEDAPIHHLADLGGTMVCLMIGDPAQRALEATAARLHLDIARLTFEESVEMRDGYAVGQCGAMADAAATLAAQRAPQGINGLRSRLLPEPLALVPVMAATATDDGAWSATVFWLMHALIRDAATTSAWQGDSAELLGSDGGRLGLRPAWRADVAAALGSYRDMIARHVAPGAGRDVNAAWPDGALLVPGTE